MRQEKVIAIGSGKGGVGKTLTTIQLALAAKKHGRTALIVDVDLGLSNVDVMLGVSAVKNLHDVVQGEASLADIAFSPCDGIRVISSGSGITQMANLSRVKKNILLDAIDIFSVDENYVLFDTGAGISHNATHFHELADISLIVTTPEPHALTDAYALMKVLGEEIGRKEFYVLINQVKSDAEGRHVFQKLAEVAHRFIRADLHHVGSVPSDQSMQRYIMRRAVLSEEWHRTPVALAYTVAFEKFLREMDERPVEDRRNWLQNLLWMGGSHESAR